MADEKKGVEVGASFTGDAALKAVAKGFDDITTAIGKMATKISTALGKMETFNKDMQTAFKESVKQATALIDKIELMKSKATVKLMGADKFRGTIKQLADAINNMNAAMTAMQKAFAGGIPSNTTVTLTASGAVYRRLGIVMTSLKSVMRDLAAAVVALNAALTKTNAANMAIAASLQTAGNTYNKTTNIVNNYTRAAAQQTPVVSKLSATMKMFLATLGSQAVARFFQMFVASTRQAIDNAVKFERHIAEIMTITQMAPKSFDQWADGVRNLSDAFGIDVLEMAKGTYEAISNQVVTAGDAFYFMAEAATFAQTTVSTVPQSVDLLTAAMNAYSLSSIHAREVAATFFAIIEVGRVKAEQLGNVMGTTANLAATLGISLDELGTGIAMLTTQGTLPNTALTLMSNIVLKLIKPSDEMAAIFAKWGVNSGQAAIAAYGFSGVLEKLGAEFRDGGLAEMADTFKDMRAIRGISGLLGGSSIGGFDDVKKRIQASKGSYDKATELIKDPGYYEFTKIMEQLKNIFTTDFGRLLLDVFLQLDKAMGGTVQSTQFLIDTLASVMTPFMAVVNIAGALVGVLTSVDSMMGSWGSTLVGMAIPALITYQAILGATSLVGRAYAGALALMTTAQTANTAAGLVAQSMLFAKMAILNAVSLAAVHYEMALVMGSTKMVAFNLALKIMVGSLYKSAIVWAAATKAAIAGWIAMAGPVGIAVAVVAAIGSVIAALASYSYMSKRVEQSRLREKFKEDTKLYAERAKAIVEDSRIFNEAANSKMQAMLKLGAATRRVIDLSSGRGGDNTINYQKELNAQLEDTVRIRGEMSASYSERNRKSRDDSDPAMFVADSMSAVSMIEAKLSAALNKRDEKGIADLRKKLEAAIKDPTLTGEVAALDAALRKALNNPDNLANASEIRDLYAASRKEIEALNDYLDKSIAKTQEYLNKSKKTFEERKFDLGLGEGAAGIAQLDTEINRILGEAGKLTDPEKIIAVLDRAEKLAEKATSLGEDPKAMSYLEEQVATAKNKLLTDNIALQESQRLKEATYQQSRMDFETRLMQMLEAKLAKEIEINEAKDAHDKRMAESEAIQKSINDRREGLTTTVNKSQTDINTALESMNEIEALPAMKRLSDEVAKGANANAAALREAAISLKAEADDAAKANAAYNNSYGTKLSRMVMGETAQSKYGTMQVQADQVVAATFAMIDAQKEQRELPAAIAENAKMVEEQTAAYKDFLTVNFPEMLKTVNAEAVSNLKSQSEVILDLIIKLRNTSLPGVGTLGTGKAMGGLIGGNSVEGAHIRASGGEFMVPQASTERNFPSLMAMASGRMNDPAPAGPVYNQTVTVNGSAAPAQAALLVAKQLRRLNRQGNIRLS